MGQAPAFQSFPAMSGDQLVLPITVKDNAGAIVSLAGATGRFALARSPTAAPVIDSAASPATATVVIDTASPATGLVTVTITDENTEALLGDYYFECKITDSGGREAVVARGWISFAENLT